MMPDRQKLCINELPEGYRLVAIEADSFVVRKPNGEDVLIQQDGHSVGVTTRPTVHPACPERRLGVVPPLARIPSRWTSARQSRLGLFPAYPPDAWRAQTVLGCSRCQVIRG